MVLHWKKVKDTPNKLVFRNTRDRPPVREFIADKYKLDKGETRWNLSYHSGESTIHNLYTAKTKRDLLETVRKYMKSNK